MKSQLVLLLLLVSTGVAMQQSKPGVNPQSCADSKKESAANTKNKPRSESEDKEEKKAAQIESFITYAQSVPAEFSADLLIQLGESGEIKDRKKRQDLLLKPFIPPRMQSSRSNSLPCLVALLTAE